MSEAEKKKLWDEYGKTRSPEVKEKIIIEYAPLVKVVAGRLSMYLGYNVEYDDLVGYGVFGLIDAIDKFDFGKGIKFETYALYWIRSGRWTGFPEQSDRNRRKLNLPSER